MVSKFIEHFGVDLEGELIKVVRPHNEITCATLHNICLNRWMMNTRFVRLKKKKDDNNKLEVLLVLVLMLSN